MYDEIYQDLKLIAVKLPSDVGLPGVRLASDILSAELMTLGMSEPGSKAISNFTSRDRDPSSDPSVSLDALRESKTDILGLYRPNVEKPEIVVYVDSCLRASTDLSIPAADLLYIVLTHEMAHHAAATAVIESGGDSYRYTWNDYYECHGESWTGLHEFLAQALTFVCLIEHHKELLDSFRKLSEHQSLVYRNWEVFDSFVTNGVSTDVVRDSLRALFLGLMKSGGRFLPERDVLHDIIDYDE
jgi:hypothetical protein